MQTHPKTRPKASAKPVQNQDFAEAPTPETSSSNRSGSSKKQNCHPERSIRIRSAGFLAEQTIQKRVEWTCISLPVWQPNCRLTGNLG
jgi:hypothetical protein